jgi:RNA polymerase sigma factor (sigma-70 family)
VAFPDTKPSLIEELRASDKETRARAMRMVGDIYWKPVYLFVRRKFQLRPEDAEDVVQSFFAEILEGDRLARFEPERARFRSYLRQCLVHFAIDQHRAQRTQKRGGKHIVEANEAELELTASPEPDPHAAFERDWMRHLMSVAVARLAKQLTERGKHRHLAVFQRFHLVSPEPSYEEVATELGIKKTDVTNSLHAARKELRNIAIDLLASITSSQDELVAEAREVFGIELDATKK